MATDTVTLTQAAKTVQLSRGTIQRWIELGLVPGEHVDRENNRLLLSPEGVKALKAVDVLRRYLPLKKIIQSQKRLGQMEQHLADSEIAIVTDPLGRLKVLKLTSDGQALAIDSDTPGERPLIPDLADYVIHDIINKSEATEEYHSLNAKNPAGSHTR